MESKKPALFYNSKIFEDFKFPFAASIICSLICHLYFITNNLINHDSIYSLFRSNDEYVLGRWALKYATSLSSYADLPLVTSTICVLALALTVCITARLFKIQNRLSIVLLAGLFSTHPAITTTLLYRYTADGYMIAMLLSTIAAYLMFRYRYGFLAAGFILGFSAGIYQAYIPYFLSLAALRLLFITINEKEDLKELLLRVLNLAMTMIIGLIVYFLGLKYSLHVHNGYLSTYQGISGLGRAAAGELPHLFKNAYTSLSSFFFGYRFINNTIYLKIAYAVILFLSAYHLIVAIIRNEVYKNRIKLLALVLLIVFLPVLINSAVFMGARSVHMLMLTSYVHIFIPLIVFLDFYLESPKNYVIDNKLYKRFLSTKIENNALDKTFLYLGTAALLFVIYSYYILDNKIYLKSHLLYENSYAFTNRLVSRIEVLDGYSYDKSVAIIGKMKKDQYPVTKPEFDELEKITGLQQMDYFFEDKPNRIISFINGWIGVKMSPASSEVIKGIIDSKEFKEMTVYPAKDSIKIINDVITVKLSNN